MNKFRWVCSRDGWGPKTVNYFPGMAVYVDALRDYGWMHGPSCHLIADSVEELMEFAVAMGLRREWFQPKSTPHFDLTAAGRDQAVEMGAIELDRRGLIAKLRELREKRSIIVE